MDTTQTVSVIVGLGSVLLGVLAYFKYKPGQKEETEVSTAQGNLNVAQGTISLVTESLHDQFKRMAEEQREQAKRLTAARNEVDGLRDDVGKLRAHSHAQDRAIERLQTTNAAWQAFGRDLHNRWPEHRQRDRPPPLPDVPTD